MRKINSQVMKEYNVMMIIRTIQQNAPISRSELTEKVGLTPVSVINITNSLIEAGILLKVGHSVGASHGRRAVMLDVNADALYTVGVELNTDALVVGICDFRGQLVKRSEASISSLEDALPVIERMAALIQRTIADLAVPRGKILGVGLALPGPLDSQSGVMCNPPNFPKWNNVPICKMLEERLALPVCCDRETNAAVLAEHLYGAAAGYQTAFMMSLFPLGAGGGFLVGGEVHHGFCDGAGEIGHTTVDPAGRACTCGSYGCLEATISEKALVKSAQQLYKMNLHVGTGCGDIDALALSDILERSAAGDAVCEHVVKQAAAHISIALGNVINLISPAVIVLGGPLPATSTQLVDLIRKHVQMKSYPRNCKDIEVVVSKLGDQSYVMGGVVLAMHAFLQKHIVQYLAASAGETS